MSPTCDYNETHSPTVSCSFANHQKHFATALFNKRLNHRQGTCLVRVMKKEEKEKAILQKKVTAMNSNVVTVERQQETENH